MSDEPESPEYTAFPLQITPDGRRAEILSEILERTAESDNLWKGREESHDERKARISEILARPDTLPLEVWKASSEGVALAGILYLTRVKAGVDATAHYLFFDHNLGSDKTRLIEETLEWVFSEHDGWEPLRRLTVEIPDYAYILARHAHKKLGFGGPYEYETDDKTFAVEGVKRDAVKWNGDTRDMLILGLTREDFRS